MNRLALIVNPKAKQLSANPGLCPRVRALAADKAYVHEPATLEDLDHVAENVFERSTDALLLVGGDGTTMACLTALERARRGRPFPTVSIAHAGTFGTVARALGFRETVLASVDRFCAGRIRPPTTQPTLRAQADDRPARVGFIFATGFVARFFEHYDQSGGGLVAAARLTARLFAGSLVGSALAREVLEPMPCRVDVDGKTLPEEAWGVIVASVVRNVGLGVRVTYRGSEDPERPHLVATPLGPRGLGFNFPRVLAARPIIGRGTVDALVQRFSVRWDPEPGPWILDGDSELAHRVEVTAGPRVPMAKLG